MGEEEFSTMSTEGFGDSLYHISKVRIMVLEERGVGWESSKGRMLMRYSNIYRLRRSKMCLRSHTTTTADLGLKDLCVSRAELCRPFDYILNL